MKRLDLQAIRGVAILLVLIFHLHPDSFSLGFIGVDLFFVLSGYLMAVILSKETFSLNFLAQFYSRRFRRIVPLYYIILLIIYAGSNFLLIRPDKKQLLLDIKWVLPFAGNVEPLFEAHGYWDQVNSTRFFVHCWSLAVEIQFYAIAPFIIFAGQQFSSKNRNRLLLFVILLSCLFQFFTPEKISYGLLPSRIWQFLLGILCFQEPVLSQKSEKIKEINESCKENYRNPALNDFIMVLMVFLTLWNPDFQGKEYLARIWSCFLVAYVISTNSTDPGLILSNKLLIFIGNISYTMYLVHWPIIVAYKYYYNIQELKILDSFFLIIIIFTVTLLAHYAFEKPLLPSSTVSALLTCILCVGIICMSRNSYLDYFIRHPEMKIGENYVDDIIQWNIAEYEKTISPLPCDPDNITESWTNFTEHPPLRCQSYSNGSLKILIIGNSIAYRAFPLIHRLFNGRYRELRLYSRSAAVPLANDPETFPEFTAATHKVVEKMKPDIIWNIHGHNSYNYLKPFDANNPLEDPIFQQFQSNLDFYSSHAKTVIIDLPYYWANIPAAYHLAKRLYLDVSDFEDLKIPRNIVEKQQFYHKRRLLALNCSNCQFIDVEKNFVENDFYYLYNRENLHAYTNDGNHLTSERLERISPVYQEIIENVLKKY